MGSSFSRVHVRQLVNNNALYGITRGTAAASKAVVLDSSKNISGLGSLNLVTLTAPATGATLTLADGSTLATSGAFSTTLTATATTSLTLPTSGTLTTTTGIGSTQCAIITAQTDVTSSTTLTAITGLAISLLAGATYAIQAYIPVTATATPGAKFSFDTSDTLTATSISYAGTLYNSTTPAASSVTTTLGNAVASVAGAGTYCILDGTIVVNAAGTLVVKIAQNTSNGTATSALVNGYLRVTRIA